LTESVCPPFDNVFVSSMLPSPLYTYGAWISVHFRTPSIENSALVGASLVDAVHDTTPDNVDPPTTDSDTECDGAVVVVVVVGEVVVDGAVVVVVDASLVVVFEHTMRLLFDQHGGAPFAEEARTVAAAIPEASSATAVTAAAAERSMFRPSDAAHAA
jgi:hypothetical protein